MKFWFVFVATCVFRSFPFSSHRAPHLGRLDCAHRTEANVAVPSIDA